ncbi:hypothetical protein [Streptomyces sp. NBC_01481]|uniref:hypothetical protein n=1 Tax=Streptomyces sp. NBC_01481 TaxID=2975869 RepID=UPI00225709C0|nr:hypothetical protein [Streptomyces sp. NBC_01481]MCX4585865.1 hypothetical protein [Streptomyces sp. NBC_01481]
MRAESSSAARTGASVLVTVALFRSRHRLVVHGKVPPLSVHAPRQPADMGPGNREIRP